MILDQTQHQDLVSGQVHLWIADIQVWLPEKGALLRTLDEEEVQRLERYKVHTKQEQFLACRGITRMILAAYLQQDPADIQFTTNKAGKPFLVDQQVQFNLSHSGSYLLLGVTYFDRIGVDIQEVYPISSMDKVIKSNFSGQEVAYLDSHPPDLRQELFFSIWTANEAYLKALGEGFGISSRSIDLLPDPNLDISFLLVDPTVTGNNPPWTIQAINLPQGYQGALAVDGLVEEVLEIRLAP